MECLKLSPLGNDFESHFHILCEDLGLYNLGQLRILNANRWAKKLRGLADKQCIGIDDWTAARRDRYDRHIQ